MTALDTNVLVRVITNDDRAQAARFLRGFFVSRRKYLSRKRFSSNWSGFCAAPTA